MKGSSMKGFMLKKQNLKLAMAAVVAMSGSLGMAQSSTSTNTSTTSAAAAAPAKKIGIKFQSFTGTDFNKATTVGGAHSENGLTVSYKPQDVKYGMTITNSFDIPGEGAESKSAVYNDVMASATVTHGGMLGTEKTPIIYSVLLPTSDASKSDKVRQVFGLRMDIILDYNISDKVTSEFLIRPTLGFRIGDDELKNKIYGELRYANTKVISTYGYFEHNAKGKIGTRTRKTDDSITAGVGIDAAPNDNITVGLAVGQDRYLNESVGQNPNKDLKFADSKDVSYTFSAVLVY